VRWSGSPARSSSERVDVVVRTNEIWAGALAMFGRHKGALSKVVNVMADAAYTGAPFVEGVGQLLGASVEIAKRNELHTFAVMPKRWVVERAFAGREKCRRLWKNCERKRSFSLQFVMLAFLALLLRRC
jgi:transposase